MKYLKYSILLTGVFSLFAGCTKDLDYKPIARPTEVSYYNSQDAVETTVTAAYAVLSIREVFDKDYYLGIGSIPSDDVEAGGETVNDWPEVQHYDQFTHNKSDRVVTEEIYNYCYKGLRMANTALEKMEIEGICTEEFIRVRTGELEFLRAFYHFTLVQVFGGVAIADKKINPVDFYTARSSIAEVLDFCEAELTDAITRLPLVQPGEPGRATKGAAQSLLAKIYLYESSYAKYYPGDDRFAGCQQQWQEALVNAEEVINSNQYSLVGYNGERFSSWRTNDTAKTIDGFRYLFTVSGDNSTEGIFEIQSINDQLDYAISRGNALTVYTTCRYWTDDAGEPHNDLGGWSFNCPSDYLVAAFRNADTRESNLNSVQGAPGTEIEDPRYATTIGQEGDSIVVTVDHIKRRMNFDNLPTKRIGRKFECSYDELWQNTWFNGPFNVRLIRYADVILMAAEAAVQLGQNTTALNYVNMVRTRARNCGTTGKPEDLGAVSLEDVMHERRLELACEPSRFFDLVRWNLAYDFINGIPNLGSGVDTEFEKGKHEFWPIPQSQIDLSKGALVQYTPWL